MSESVITKSEESSSKKIENILREISEILKQDPAKKQQLERVLIEKFKDEEVAQEIRKTTWATAVNIPYYREHFAKELLPVLDAMIEDGKDREFRFDHFPALRKRSLHTKVYQSFMWILDFHDADKRYYQLRQKVSICITSTGIRLKFTDKDLSPLVAVTIDAKIAVAAWKDKIDKFLEDTSPDNKKLYITGLSLTDEQREDIENSLMALENILYKVTGTEIKIIKK